MATPVFLTVDTEFAWRHHAAGLDVETIYARSLEPAGVGLTYQLERLAHHGLKACFFVDPMPALLFGLAPVRRMVETVLAAGQEVQLHLHPNWTGAHAGDRAASYGRFQMHEYGHEEQLDLLRGAVELLVAAGAPRPIAFRAGGYAANDDTLRALATLGFVYDSSHNGAEPAESRIGLPPSQIAPVARHLVEVPVTVIEDAPGIWRTFQLCAMSGAEAAAALDHAAAERHAAVTIVSHGFELANRLGTRANAVHVRRFETLCRLLAARAEALPTMHFADRPTLALDRDDRPLAANGLRRRLRQAEQLWSNLVAERAA
ncbi:polysaccharide deacetylase [Sphingomonas sp. RP10(2022)]|uniref:Polysaccharide deacetylase n=1 Tax=Sphingomonas liriopis TaxID=2949094 RepID=A0A9X2HWR3_9SPHN|nr:polysaccharide deacetylase [Sphingomonas liriopis]MCP3734210.1 polysaccharide deacetylase [Sphingomonas liriopis]